MDYLPRALSKPSKFPNFGGGDSAATDGANLVKQSAGEFNNPFGAFALTDTGLAEMVTEAGFNRGGEEGGEG